MNTKQKRKLFGVIALVVILSAAIGLILFALKQNINLFYKPTQLLTAQVNSEQSIRLGGYVKQHSVHYDASGQGVSFVVTDKKNELSVSYHGILPNLFREGQGVVITGNLNDHHSFDATQVLAKHDEKYMPLGIK